jgi:sugar O-acyltransferase (sialic acid O-acetyltransferase NeuD family)
MNGMRSVLLGAGGHARVVLDAMRSCGLTLPELALDEAKSGSLFDGVPVDGGDEMLPSLVARGITYFVIGVGGLGTSPLRPRLWARAMQCGLEPLTVRHSSAVISESVVIGPGAQILAGTVINAGARLGAGVIVNTAVVVEHDCMIGEFCHIAPRSCLGGGVCLGENSHVGLGAVIREYRTIGRGTLVGAGAVVVSDLPEGCKALGVPAKPVK